MSSDIERWVDESAALTKPDKVYWCDGSKEEYDALISGMLADKTLLELNQKTYPGCYLHRSNPNDVARTEKLTFICPEKEEDAGPNNNWMTPARAKEKVRPLYDGAMKGRTMYAIPYLMGPVGSPFSKMGLQVTDSPYVAANMHIMTRVGTVAMDHYARTKEWVPGLHSVADCNPDRRFILHFPEEKLIWSIGSGYGGNALLGKKCFALRIASYMAKQQGWMAEHMLIIGVEDPSGKVTHMAAAFPSASGKTNLAMLVSALQDEGYKVWTVGDDIAWMHVDKDGYLRAINPEAGFFGVAPGTAMATNPIAMKTIDRNTIFTNVGLTPSGEPWWEGMGTDPQSGMIDWQGNPWKPNGTKAAHPNSRFTAPARQCPTISKHWEDPEGVVISAIIFGSRRSVTVPLVNEAFNWQHGVFMGSSMGAETTAAATGAVGVVRRDPMAMLPFCGYNMADYFGHWLAMGKKIKHQPKIFRVNWFRKDGNGKYIWPGYGENIRILQWILGRIEGTAQAVETEIGFLPANGSLNTEGLSVSPEAMDTILSVDKGGWRRGIVGIEEFYGQFGDRLPSEIRQELDGLRARIG